MIPYQRIWALGSSLRKPWDMRIRQFNAHGCLEGITTAGRVSGWNVVRLWTHL